MTAAVTQPERSRRVRVSLASILSSDHQNSLFSSSSHQLTDPRRLDLIGLKRRLQVNPFDFPTLDNRHHQHHIHFYQLSRSTAHIHCL
jgi:hypothetical protein